MTTTLNDNDSASIRMRKTVSIGNTPNSIGSPAAAVALLDSSESNSKSDPAGLISA